MQLHRHEDISSRYRAGAIGTAMAVPVCEGGKMVSLRFYLRGMRSLPQLLIVPLDVQSCDEASPGFLRGFGRPKPRRHEGAEAFSGFSPVSFHRRVDIQRLWMRPTRAKIRMGTRLLFCIYTSHP